MDDKKFVKKVAKKPQFEHCSMAGTEFINCEILSRNAPKDKYLIKYLDPISTEWIEKWVEQKYVKNVK